MHDNQKKKDLRVLHGRNQNIIIFKQQMFIMKEELELSW